MLRHILLIFDVLNGLFTYINLLSVDAFHFIIEIDVQDAEAVKLAMCQDGK